MTFIIQRTVVSYYIFLCLWIWDDPVYHKINSAAMKCFFWGSIINSLLSYTCSTLLFAINLSLPSIVALSDTNFSKSFSSQCTYPYKYRLCLSLISLRLIGVEWLHTFPAVWTLLLVFFGWIHTSISTVKYIVVMPHKHFNGNVES